MSRLFRLSSTRRRDPEVERWLSEKSGELGEIARRCFEFMRECGGDVGEALHDGQPTACIDDAAFGYVDVFKAHVNVGFFHGAELDDPAGILEGTGKFMRHVKLRPGEADDMSALLALIETSYCDLRRRLGSE